MNMIEELTVTASLESLGDIRQFIRKVSSDAGIEKNSSYKLQLAIDEIATNIISHGYEEAGLSGDILLKSEINEKNLIITISDTGKEFDPRNATLPTEEDLIQSLEDRPIGGLGIFLALRGVDAFDYNRDGDRNNNIFIMNRP